MQPVGWRFQQSNNLDQHNLPWTGNLCQEICLQYEIIPSDHETGHERHHKLLRGISFPAHSILSIRFLLPNNQEIKDSRNCRNIIQGKLYSKALQKKQ